MKAKIPLKHANLAYLQNKPKYLRWKVVAGPPDYCLDYLQTYDLIFDDYDLKIRKLV